MSEEANNSYTSEDVPSPVATVNSDDEEEMEQKPVAMKAPKKVEITTVEYFIASLHSAKDKTATSSGEAPAHQHLKSAFREIVCTKVCNAHICAYLPGKYAPWCAFGYNIVLILAYYLGIS